jgi:hypothetical protein
MKFKNITKECRDNLIHEIETILDTRDKRYMFMRMEFKSLTPTIDLEGSPRQAAWNMYYEFEKQSMLGSLISTMNAKFNSDIKFETEF